jgi:hypothetical protein
VNNIQYNESTQQKEETKGLTITIRDNRMDYETGILKHYLGQKVFQLLFDFVTNHLNLISLTAKQTL